MTEKHQHHPNIMKMWLVCCLKSSFSPSLIKFQSWQVQEMEFVMTIIRDSPKSLSSTSSQTSHQSQLEAEILTIPFWLIERPLKYLFLICLKLTQQWNFKQPQSISCAIAPIMSLHFPRSRARFNCLSERESQSHDETTETRSIHLAWASAEKFSSLHFLLLLTFSWTSSPFYLVEIKLFLKITQYWRTILRRERHQKPPFDCKLFHGRVPLSRQ